MLYMSQTLNTILPDDTTPNDYHRLQGKNCPAINFDMFEYKKDWQTGRFIYAAICDYKHGKPHYGNDEHVSDQYDGIQVQRQLADDLHIPFFISITYLSEWCNPKCYFVIPANHIAVDWLIDHNLGAGLGVWMSLRQHAELLHDLRGLTFNPEEKITAEVRHSLRERIPNIEQYQKLADLPTQIHHYQLPRIYIRL